jgi:hypothetical protein
MDEQEIRERVEKRIKQRNEFYSHLVIYIAVNLMLWVIWGLSDDSRLFEFGFGGFDDVPWPIFSTLGWGLGVLIHGLSVYFNSPGRADAHERMVQREVERERERLEAAGLANKRKRDALYRLSDDGELIEVTDDEVEEKRKYQ